mmetsp:Transcript_29585/g.58395  ORF Transcript_29585/g.58395 Transcript_29585/m.58395 type:complete len:89 (+) Transcript_29585:5374-5640(+)
MNKKGSKLAENILWHISGALRCDDGGQAVFPAFLGDETKGIEVNAILVIADRSPNELVSFIQEANKRVLSETPLPRYAKQIAPKSVQE